MIALVTAIALAATPAPAHLGPSLPRSRSSASARAAVPEPSMYPIRTPGLALKARNPERLSTKFVLGRPICIVGTDRYSANWLQANASQFVTGGVLCYVVRVASAQELAALRGLTKVPLAPISGQVFVDAGLKGFPALITQSGAIQ